MRAISWNLGGVTFRSRQRRAWNQLLAWNPDVALVQEVYRPDWLPPETWTFTEYEGIPNIGTLIYSKQGLTPVQHTGPFASATVGQVSLAEIAVNGEQTLFASVHAVTDAIPADLLASLDTADISSWGGKSRYSLDLILEDLRPLTVGRRFVVGGDFNASIRFDVVKRAGSAGSAYTKWFLKARDARWRLAHSKFHVGDQRTLFRKGRDEPYQLDHFFVDDQTWESLIACDVLEVPYLEEFSDHAPLAMEWPTVG